MAIAIMLDQYSLPEKGAAELKINRVFQINITADEAQKKVNHWLFTQVSCMMGAATPTLAVGPRIVWRVPAILTATHLGEVGAAGTVDVDVQTGEMDSSPLCKERILQGASALADKLPPYQPHEAIPDEYMATPIQPVVVQLQGKPHDIIAATRSASSK